MKRGTPTHTKTRRLMRRLGVPQYIAVGILESIWHLTANERPRGDIGALSDADIADAIGWERDPQDLIAALTEAGWLDRCEAHRLIIHDWHAHADEAVRKRVSRMNEGWAKVSRDVETHPTTVEPSGCLPEPVPEPTPEPEPTPREGPAAAAERRESADGDAQRIGTVMRLLVDVGFSLGDAKRLSDRPEATVERVRWLVTRKFPPGTRTQSIAKGIRDGWDVPNEPKPETPKQRAARLVAEMAAEKAR